MIKLNQTINSKIALVTAAFFISAFVIIPSIQEKAYATQHEKVEFKITVKHVFEANSKIKITYKSASQTKTIPGNSGTQQVTIDFFVAGSSPPNYTICLSAPNHAQKCMQEQFSNTEGNNGVIIVHKTVDMRVLPPH